jgi:hypothetical protein
MEFKKIYFGHLQNDEHYQFCGEFAEQISGMGAAALKIEAQFAEWKACYAREDKALKKIYKSALTEKIAEADRRRDRTFRGIVDNNRSLLNHFNPATVEAARLLQIVFDAYGNIPAQAMTSKTGAYTGLVQELKGEQHATAVKIAGLGDWIDKLAENNSDLFGLVQQRNEETAARTDVVTAEAREQTDAAYGAIAKRISALLEIEKSDVYKNFIRRINVILDRYNNAIALRRGRGEVQAAVPSPK